MNPHMRNSLHTLLIACALATFAPLAGCASQRAHADAPRHDQLDLSWLQGAWTTHAWDGTLNADYATRPDGLTIGYTYLTKDGVQAYHEFELFARDADADYLIPYPGGKPAPRFNLASRDTKSATYENPDKSFPTRIVYQRFADTLIITLSDPFKNSADPIVFTFTPRTN